MKREPIDDYARRLFRAMKESHCGDRLWRLMSHIVVLFRKIRMEMPVALTRYDEIKKNVFDICYVHSLFEPRMKLYEYRDKKTTPRHVSMDIQTLIKECNLFHALVYNASDHDSLRAIRDSVKRFAVEVTIYDPSVMRFEERAVDSLLETLDDSGHAGLIMRRATVSSPIVAKETAKLMLAASKANMMLDASQDMISKAVDELYSLGLFDKYFKEVLQVIREGQKYSLVRINTTDSTLPHGLEMASVVVTMAENNIGEKARDLVFGLSEDSSERKAVLKLIGGLNIFGARGTVELPTVSDMFELRSRIKMYAMSLYHLNKAAIDDPTLLVPDQIATILASPTTKAKLRELERDPDLHRVISLLLHDINDYQVTVKYLTSEAKKLAFVIRQFDETVVPDLGLLASDLSNDVSTAIRQDEVIVNKVVQIAKAKKYIESLESYLFSEELDLSAELSNHVSQFLEIMRILSEQSTKAVSFQDMTESRDKIIDALEDLVDDYGVAPPDNDPISYSTIEIVEICNNEERVVEIRVVFENVPANTTVSPEVYEKALKGSKRAQIFLEEREKLNSKVKIAVDVLRVVGEALHKLTSALGKTGTIITPDPSNRDSLYFSSMIYDYHVWPSLRIDDMAFRLKYCNATSLKEDRTEMINIIKEGGISGFLNNKGWLVHILVELVIGLLGVGDDEMKIREAAMNTQILIKGISDISTQESSLFRELSCVGSIPSLHGYYLGGEVYQVYKKCSFGPPEIATILQYLTVVGNTEDMIQRCDDTCFSKTDSPLLDAGSKMVAGCAHYTIAGDPTLYSKILPLKGRMDVAQHSVRCCHPVFQTPVSMDTYGCHFGKTFYEAKEICESAKLRLCSQMEINTCRTCHTGCGFDRDRIWTADPVGTCSSSNQVTPANSLPTLSPVCRQLCNISRMAARNAELVADLDDSIKETAVIVRDESPQCVPSILILDIARGERYPLIKALTTASSIEALVHCIDGLPHGMKRVHANSLLYLLICDTSSFTSLVDGGPGTIPAPDADPNDSNPGPCSGNGIYANGKCICSSGYKGTKCEEFVDPEQEYNEGWTKGFEDSHLNETTPTQPRDIVTQTANLFDSAAKLLKSTTLSMAKIDPKSEIRQPTSYLSPVELMYAIEDVGWLHEYRSGPSAAFNSIIPKVLKEESLLRREYDDIVTMIKHLAIKAATIDCKSMKMIVFKKNGEPPICGDVASTITEMDPHNLLQKCLTTPILDELGTLARMERTSAMRQIVDDMLVLVNVVLLHTACPGQCNKRGVCLLRQCHCFQGWVGVACTHEVKPLAGECTRNCSGHGTCVDGNCKCDRGWKALDCSFNMVCPNDCWRHGDCIDGRCLCYKRWKGSDCSVPREICPDDYKCLHGKCVDSSCICDEGWTGDDCTIGSFVHRGADAFWDDEGVKPTVFIEESGGRGQGKIKLEDVDLTHPWV